MPTSDSPDVSLVPCHCPPDAPEPVCAACLGVPCGSCDGTGRVAPLIAHCDVSHRDLDLSAWLAHHMACLDEDNPEQCQAHRRAGIAYQAVELIAQEFAER